jgi:ketosteroid isomerase-like protein
MTHARTLAALAAVGAVALAAPAADAQRVSKDPTPARTPARRPNVTPAPARRPASTPAGAAGAPGAATASSSATNVAVSKTLAEADAEFAQHVARAGFRDAMLPALADDAVLFMPRPVPGRTWLASSAPPAGTYSWSPAWSAISGDGSLGLTSGPIAIAAPAPDSSRTGQYVTVWSRTPIGWKIQLHMIVPGPQEPSVTYAPHKPAGDGRPRGGPGAIEATRATLFMADRALYAASQKDGLATAVSRVVTPDVRLLRGGALPAVGPDSLRSALARDTQSLIWQTAGDLIMARSGDLGVTYGLYERRNATGGVTEWGSFVRAWERQPDGGWRILLDALSPSTGR